MSWEDNEVVVKEEANYDSDATVVYEPEEYDGISGDGASDSVNELQLIPLSEASSTDSTGRKSDRSSNKRKKSHQQHPSSKTDFSARPIVFKREDRSSRKRSWNEIPQNQQDEPQLQVAPDFSMLEHGTPPAPILFKRDRYTEEEEKERNEKDQEGMQCVELVEDKDEDTSTETSDYDIATYSTGKPKSNATKSAKKSKSLTEKKQKTHSSPTITVQGQAVEIPFKCNLCQRIFKYKRNLTSHMKNECGKKPSFSCALCDHRTSWKSHLKRHLIKVHDVNDSQLAALGIGQKIRPVLQFKCNKCPRSYKLKENLNRHVQHECDVDPRFQCIFCKHRFKQKDVLRNHLTAVHGIGPADFLDHGVGYAFQCDLCSFSFGQNAALKKHVTTEHAGK